MSALCRDKIERSDLLPVLGGDGVERFVLLPGVCWVALNPVVSRPEACRGGVEFFDSLPTSCDVEVGAAGALGVESGAALNERDRLRDATEARGLWGKVRGPAAFEGDGWSGESYADSPPLSLASLGAVDWVRSMTSRVRNVEKVVVGHGMLLNWKELILRTATFNGTCRGGGSRDTVSRRVCRAGGQTGGGAPSRWWWKTRSARRVAPAEFRCPRVSVTGVVPIMRVGCGTALCSFGARGISLRPGLHEKCSQIQHHELHGCRHRIPAERATRQGL